MAGDVVSYDFIRPCKDVEDFSGNNSFHPLDGEDTSDGEQVCEDFDCDCDFYTPERNTTVFWDLAKYPISRDNLQHVETNITSALYQMGIHGVVSLVAFGEKLDHLKDDLLKAGIFYIGESEMTMYLIRYARSCSGKRAMNIVVLPGPDPDSELHRVLKCLESRNHDVLLVYPPDDDKDGLFLGSVESVFGCTRGVYGGEPIIRGGRLEDTPEIKGITGLQSLLHRNSGITCQGFERRTFVLWDLLRFPIPPYACMRIVGKTIRSALKEIGNHGRVEILAYGGDKLKLNHLKDDFNRAGIIYLRLGYTRMAQALRYFADECLPGTLMVIPKPDRDTKLDKVLRDVQRHYNTVLIVNPPAEGSALEDKYFLPFLHSVDAIVECTQDLDGGEPIIRGTWMGDVEDFSSLVEHHISGTWMGEMENFSKPITPVKGVKGGVFWDLEDFPFPADWTPDVIHAKIKSAFRDDVRRGDVSIWVYVDDKDGPWGGDFLKYKTWKPSIYFLPGGVDKSARRDRMLHDIHLWQYDSPIGYNNPALIVLSDQVKDDQVFSARLRSLHEAMCNVCLVTPPEKKAVPAAIGSEWPKSHFGVEYTFGEKDGMSMPKNRPILLGPSC